MSENILDINGRQELRDRVIGKYVLTISRNNLGFDEKTYELINKKLNYVSTNNIPIGHPRHSELSDKLNMENL